jgi:N-acetylmuramoyl-L-alanine amidase
LEEIYVQTIAEKFIHDKSLIVKELNKHGILTVLTRPKDLSVKLVNKYLELKDRNLI